MDWRKLDWTALDRLRDSFLRGSAMTSPYWQSMSDLAAYDVTYAERIGWKWDAVLAELRRRRWELVDRSDAGSDTKGNTTTVLSSSGRKISLLDWGCGSGVAGRRVAVSLGLEKISALQLWDHSPLAVEFATARARAEFPSLNVQAWDDNGKAIDILVLSHVLNELPLAAQTQLRAIMARASVVLWVEPGTHATARALQSWREKLRETFYVIAPCTHQKACGLQLPDNERHWCHHFAAPPSEIFADSDWVKFGQRAGIDLRSLPYAFLVLARISPVSMPTDTARIIGRPEHFKGFARLLSCSSDGVEELELQKRADPALFKLLKHETIHPPYHWRRESGRIVGTNPVL